jgi:dihydroflavonol-4-reductase
VRDPEKSRRQGYLTALDGADDRLELVGADLLTPGAFDGAVAGCEYVMHTASPYVLTVKDAQRDLADPAVQGHTVGA